MSILDLFKPAPYTNEISDDKEVKKLFRYWRIRTLYSMYVGYALFYFTRKSVTFAMPAMAKDLGLDKVELGMFGTILSLTYGASKFLSGVMSDRSNPRYFMSVGLILTGIFNILFGFSSTFLVLAIFWGLNGWFQGWGWPPCAKLLTHWYSQSERGSWWSIWNTSHNIGGGLIPLFVAFIAQQFNWRYAMYTPGVICIFGGLFLMNRLRDTPRSLGLPTIEKFKNDYPNSYKENDKVELSAKEILFTYVIKNKFIWLLAVASFFVYIIRTAANDWTLLYLVEAKGYSYFASGSGIFWFEMGGFLGSICAGWGSDLLFKGKRGPVNALFAIGVIFVLLAFWKLPITYFVLDIFFLFLIGFFIFGPQMLIGVAAAELSHKKAAGTATGFIGWFGYLGAAVAGAPLGGIIKHYGWSGFFFVLCL
ncbi:MAG: MFS transporter family glucose-6-phosphate receptor UhpC, partial [Chlamydiae bacterium]|nr:MFS transporter family glucose-6-phosphate receptor UhpC [Chlamydiota bacterium]